MKLRTFQSLKALLATGWLAVFAGTAAAEFPVPLNATNGWQFLNYRGIPPNEIRVTTNGLEIAVDHSAAPAVFPLPLALPVTALRVSGSLRGSLKIPAGRQGEKGFDDFAVRVGLVESGTRTLGWREKLFAADWVRKLFALAPAGTGIRQIHFFNVGVATNQIGSTRTHPLSDLMTETTVTVPDADGNFTFTQRLSAPMKVVAIWISTDGDDTQSTFAVTLNRVELATEANPFPPSTAVPDKKP